MLLSSISGTNPVLMWNFDPTVIFGCGALLAVYAGAVGFKFNRRGLLWSLGVLTVFIALTSPVHDLGERYLFTAHMFQHLLLLLVAAPLLVLGLPVGQMKRALRIGWVARLEKILSQPVFAWVLSIGILWVWHIPALYNAALVNHDLHIIEHLSFLVTSVIFWWGGLKPIHRLQMNTVPAIMYFFFAALASSVLGLLLAVAPTSLFPTYANPIDTSNLLPIIRGQWGLTAQLDQQIGGVMMWATGGFGYIVGVIVVMIRWYRRDLVKTFQENMALELAGEAQAAENEKARLAGAIIEA
jgi:cytochrome c oxidase assembly factor CtaG